MSVAREHFGQTAGDFSVADNPSLVHRLTEQPLLQATTTPRKRVVLDYDPATKKISTKFTLKNSSIYAFAFKVNSSFEGGYVAKPGLGIVPPGEAFEVTILANDSKSLGRDLEKDKFTIDLRTADTDTADNISFDDKRTLFVGISQAVRERLDDLAEEQKRKQQLDEVRSRQRRVLTYIGAGVLLLLGVVFVCVDFCYLPPESFQGGGEKAEI